MSNNVPKLRFKGFTEEWEEKRLGEISEITKLAGFEFTQYVQYSDSGSIIALRGLNVKNGRINLDDVKYIDNSDFSKLNRSKLYINDLLFTYVGTIGDVAIVNENNKYYLAPNVCRIRINNNNSYLVKLLISSDKFYKKIIIPSITTSSQPALSMENIRLFNIMIPSIEEQEKIANFLTKVDKIIEKQEEKVRNLESYKKGMMQKIFSQEIRFKDENGEEYPKWEKKRLGNITKLTDGVHFTPEYVSSGIPFWSVETIVSNAQPKFITEEAHKLAIKRCHPEKNDILITRIGTLAKSIVLTNNNDLSIYVSVALIKSSKVFNSKYIKQYFDSQEYYKEFLSKSLLTATPKKINMEDLKDTRVNLPCLEEQTKIANFLSKIDSIVEKEKEKLQELRLWKKGLLQQMFV